MTGQGEPSGWRQPSAGGRSAPGKAGSRWARVGLISAGLWAVLGLVLAYLSSSLGSPTLSGPAALLSGPVALVVVGWRYKLHGAGDWIRAGLTALGAGLVVGGVLIFFWTMLEYG